VCRREKQLYILDLINLDCNISFRGTLELGDNILQSDILHRPSLVLYLKYLLLCCLLLLHKITNDVEIEPPELDT
jgi:hypothetical protein